VATEGYGWDWIEPKISKRCSGFAILTGEIDGTVGIWLKPGYALVSHKKFCRICLSRCLL